MTISLKEVREGYLNQSGKDVKGYVFEYFAGIEVRGGTLVTPGVAAVEAVAEVQTQDLTGIAGDIGDTIRWTFGDARFADLVLTAAITDDADMDAALNGETITDSAGREWTLAASGDDGTVTLTQAAGHETPVGAITSTVVFDTSESEEATNPTDGTGTVTVEGVAAITAVAEVHSQDLTGIVGSIDDIITWTFGDGETASFTLTAAITGDDDMDTALNGETITDTANRNWDITASGDNGVITLTQADGHEEPVGVVQKAVLSSVAGVIGSTTLLNFAGHLARVSSVPGDTAPDAIALTVKDPDGVDLLDGAGAAISVGAVSHLTQTDCDFPIPFAGSLTVAIADQGVASAGGIIVLYVY